MNAASMEEALSLANRLWSRDLMVETAGLFWIAAELAILYLVLLARFHVEHHPREPSPRLTPKFRRRALVWTAGFLVLCLALIARFYLYPLPDMLEAALRTQASPGDIALLYARWAYAHSLIWCAFITLWVVLETAIVYHGRHVYIGLRKALADRHPAGRPPPQDTGLGSRGGSFAPLAVLVVPAAFVILSAEATAGRGMGLSSTAPANVFLDTHEAFAALRNAVGLYLRVAGVVWITVEWTAAFYLWRGYRLLRDAAPATSTDSSETRRI